jgi:hypothetical protein
MKSEKDKYVEAVARNLKSARQNPKYKEKTYAQAKIMLGVRKNDTSYDKEIEAVIK